MGLSSVAIVDVDARHIVHVVQLDDLKGHHVDAKPIGQHLTRFRAVRKNVRVNGIERQLRTMGRLKHARMIKHPGRDCLLYTPDAADDPTRVTLRARSRTTHNNTTSHAQDSTIHRHVTHHY